MKGKPTKKDEENPAPRTQTTTSPSNNNTTNNNNRSGRRNLSMDIIQLCFLGQIFCALILLLEFQRRKISDYYGYGLAVTIVAMVLAFLGMLLYSAKYEDGYGKTVTSSITMGQLITNFLVLWWFVAAIVLTFNNGPFTYTGNGYFAVWGGLLFAAGAMGDGVTSHSSMSATFGMMICSIVILIAIPGYVEKGNGVALYALLVAAFTVLVLLLYFFATTPLQTNPTVALFVFGLLAIFWLVLPFFTTFPGGPFRATGNGYFASWIGALVAVIAASGAYNLAA